MQDVPAADGVTRHHSDHRFGDIADVTLQLQHIQAWYAIIADITGMTAHFLIAARAERPDAILAAGTVGCDPQNPNIAIMPGLQHRLGHLIDGFGAKRVADIGTIEGDARDALALVISDVVITLDFLPVDQLHQVGCRDSRLLFRCRCHSASPFPTIQLSKVLLH